MRKIVFWMPRACMEPAGGFKVIFEYANRLAKDGFSVEIIYPMIRSMQLCTGLFFFGDSY